MKQTAVEWLFNQIKKEMIGIEYDYADEFNQLFEQAKEMEKEQIENAYKEGNHSEMRGGKVIFEKMEQYYNETYGGDK
jgi:hypothetical protein